MAAIQCPKCGLQKDVPDEFRGRPVKCPKCATEFRIPGTRGLVFLLAYMAVFVALGGLSYVCFHFLTREHGAAIPSEQARNGDNPGQTDEERQAKEEQRRQELAARTKAQEQTRLDEERKAEEARKKAEEEKLAQERQRQEKLAREEQERKEKLAREEQERRVAARKDPKLTPTLDEVDRAPDTFFGQCVVFDRVKVKSGSIEKHKEVGRFTVGVAAMRGDKFFSRVPLNSLFFSTSDRIGNDLLNALLSSDDFYRLKLYCEIRKFDKKWPPAKLLPEAYIYKVEAYNLMGQLRKTFEE